MRMSEAEFLNRLNKAFPEKVIFAEQSRLSVRNHSELSIVILRLLNFILNFRS